MFATVKPTTAAQADDTARNHVVIKILFPHDATCVNGF